MDGSVKRRRVTYHTFDEMLVDIERLKRDGYQRVGNWDLPYICCHLADSIERSMDGYTVPPRPMRIAAPIVLLIVLWMGRMPAGVKVDARALPSGSHDLNEQFDRLCYTIVQYQAHRGELHPHPFFGRIARAKFDRLHLIHAAHHLSFLV
jgi:hypothetical protein